MLSDKQDGSDTRNLDKDSSIRIAKMEMVECININK